MAGFLYYAPGKKQPLTRPEAVDAFLCELGLDHVDRAIQSRVVMNHGPDGKSGLIFGPADTPRLGYYANEQTWWPVPDRPYWIGWQTDAQPGPEDLARKSQLAGIPLTLADGNKWVIPLAQHWDGQTQLPVIYRLGKGGVEKDVVPALKPFQEAVQKFLDVWKAALEKGEEPTYPDDELFDLAGLALSLNYKIGRWEALALGLLQSSRYADMSSVWDVCSATFNWQGVMAALATMAEKKRDPEEHGDSGEKADCQNTGQPSEICS